MPQILVAGKESFEEKGKFSYVITHAYYVREGLKLFQVISKEVGISPWKADFDSSSNFSHNSSWTDGWVGGWMDEWIIREKDEWIDR